jgi:hypothetical protein
MKSKEKAMKSKSLFLPRIEAFQAVMAAFGEDS